VFTFVKQLHLYIYVVTRFFNGHQTFTGNKIDGKECMYFNICGYNMYFSVI
jgi:hypothetical protein